MDFEVDEAAAAAMDMAGGGIITGFRGLRVFLPTTMEGRIGFMARPFLSATPRIPPAPMSSTKSGSLNMVGALDPIGTTILLPDTHPRAARIRAAMSGTHPRAVPIIAKRNRGRAGDASMDAPIVLLRGEKTDKRWIP